VEERVMAVLTEERIAERDVEVVRPGAGRAWLWLAAGAVLLPFAMFQTVLPIAAWLAPVFLLRFTRSVRPRMALPVIGVVYWVASVIGLRGFLPSPDIYIFALGGVTAVIAFGLDRLLARRLGGVLGTLVYPAADTALAFLPAVAVSGAFATFGAAAYSQGGDLPLLQVVSVTGIWGLGFLIAWLAPVVNDLWEHGFDLRAVRGRTAAFAAVLAAVLLFGGLRLAFPPEPGPAVRVAGLAPDRALAEAVQNAELGPRPLSEADREAAAEQYLEPLADDLFERTREAAQGGARIVSWSEAAAGTFAEDEAGLLDRAADLAREEGIYLQIGLLSLQPTDAHPLVEIRAVMFGPDGATLFDYPKATRPLSDTNEPGPGIVPVVDTPYGRVATVICFDADMPWLVRQAGQADADILLVPSSDWQEVAETHSRMADFRAVENGVAMVRATRFGVSTATDPFGRGLAYKADYFTGEDQTLWANVPTAGTSTVYTLIGDAFAWAAVTLLAVLCLMGLLRRRSRG
jgi:apolipoprotein N-acyltransferase